MEFWGVELKGDKPVKVVPEMSEVVHLSHATLAEIKKGGETVMLSAKTGDQKFVIGVLKPDNIPQLSFDLVFEKEFELSHNWKNGTVHLTGYKSLMPDEDEEEYSDFSDEEEPLALEDNKPNGIVAAPAVTKPKPAAIAAKKDQKPKEESDDEDEDDDDSEDESGEDDESDEEMADGDEDDSDEDESDEEEEETPVKSAADKKRPSSALKTPEAKKAKLVTPQKTDGGKKSVGGHVATPHPAKNAAKTPKSGGAQVACGSCKKSFNSQGALDSHNKAKHSAAK